LGRTLDSWSSQTNQTTVHLRPQVGEKVVLVAVPPGLVDGLPVEDQRAIAAIVGKPVDLIGWDELGRAELHFDDPFDLRTDEYSHSHSIWVAPEFIVRQSESEPIDDLAFRRATESDADEIADAHRDAILHLGSPYYAPAIVAAWAQVVGPPLYLDAMDRGEVFFIATGTVAGHSMVLGFTSDYVLEGTTHGTSAYVRPVAARRRVGSRLLAMAESFGKARGATAVQLEASLGAVSFYAQHGFVETGRGDVALPSGFRMPCVFMRKELR
jgi:GNAT superfamily N-acetyltransferase